MWHLDYRDKAVLILVSLLALLTLVELIMSYIEDRKYYQTRDTFTNIYLTTLTFFINLAVKTSTFFVLDFVYRFRLFTMTNAVLYWIVLIVLQDFLYWVLHYTGHYCRLFWAMHVTHHSSEHFNLTTGFRSTVFEPLYRVVFYLPLALMGFTALDILFAYLLTQLYGNMVHTQYKIPLPKWYGYVFVTPSQHRVHHASNLRYLDKNMGMVFIIWDRIFGTFKEEDGHDEIKYGLTKQPEDTGPVNVLFHEWKALINDMKHAPGLKNKLKTLFYAPGWSYDGSTKTARVMQRELTDKRIKEMPGPSQNSAAA
ncbi:MAG: sterol desaturase family protein [Bacteroidota bacterium]